MKAKAKKPIIGVTLCYGQDGQLLRGVKHNLIRREYGEQLRLAGASPIFLDASIDPAVAAELCDGIVISGGQDIHPSFYEGSIRPQDILEPLERTTWEQELIRACDARGRRILGICYGAQLLNVHYGGTLYSNITTDVVGVIEHGTTKLASLHEVTFNSDFLGFKAHDVEQAACRHHQAVKDLAPGFEIAAQTSDGVVEAIAGHGHFGVQWHAEADGTAERIYKSFVQLVAQGRFVAEAADPQWLRPEPKLV